MYKIAMVADLHHFSQRLTDFGRAYQLRQSADQKCLAESGAIIDAVFRELAESDCDAVFVAGDMSNDGERFSHEEMKEKFERLAEKKPLFVTYATHDWCCDGKAKRYEGDKHYTDVETMTVPQLRELYRDFGLKQSYDEYITHLEAASYAVKLGGIRLIAVNDDQDGKGHSGYSDEHFEWILKHVADAKANGETVIVMQHHLLLPNLSMLVNKGQIIGEHEQRAAALAEAGADFVIVGHSHMLRTTCMTGENGNVLTQINLGALCGHPACYTTLTVDEDEYKIETHQIKNFTYDSHEYTADYITEHTKGVLMGILKAAATDKEEFVARTCQIDEGIKPEKMEKLYPIASRAAKYALKVKVGSAARLVNALTLGKGIRCKDAVRQIKNDNLLEHIMDVYLAVFDGSARFTDKNDPTARIVMDAVTIPQRIKLPIKALKKEKTQKLFKQIEETASELVYPSEPNNQSCVIKRRK